MKSALRWCVVPLLATTLVAQTAPRPKSRKAAPPAQPAVTAEDVQSLRDASNWLMIPAVRRAVDASLAGLLVARVATMPAAALAEAETQSAYVAVLAVRPLGNADAPERFGDFGQGRSAR